MSHELTIRSSGLAEMAFAGEGAWHGLGQRLERGAAIEAWREAAGMDWKIQRSKVRYAVAHGSTPDAFITDEANHVLFRSDSKAPLGIVSSKYQVVQPGEVLEFFRDLVGANGFELETAGTLFGGRRFWALANIGEEAVIGTRDKVGGYLLLSTSADGSLATGARFTTVRVVCNNTLSMALSAKDKNEVKVTHRSVFDADRVKNELGIARGQFARFIGGAKALAKAKIAPADAQELTLRLLGGKKLAAAGNDVKKTTAAVEEVVSSKGFKTIQALFEGKGLGSDLDSANGTAWGWVNAVTQYVDYAAPARSDNNRLNSAWFGDGDVLKTAAMESALAFI